MYANRSLTTVGSALKIIDFIGMHATLVYMHKAWMYVGSTCVCSNLCGRGCVWDSMCGQWDMHRVGYGGRYCVDRQRGGGVLKGAGHAVAVNNGLTKWMCAEKGMTEDMPVRLGEEVILCL